MPNKIFKGLPAKAYTDKDFWQKESDTVFTNSWVFVGFVHELINIGDALPITIANQPILILKNAKGTVVDKNFNEIKYGKKNFLNPTFFELLKKHRHFSE